MLSLAVFFCNLCDISQVKYRNRTFTFPPSLWIETAFDSNSFNTLVSAGGREQTFKGYKKKYGRMSQPSRKNKWETCYPFFDCKGDGLNKVVQAVCKGCSVRPRPHHRALQTQQGSSLNWLNWISFSANKILEKNASLSVLSQREVF